MTPDTVKSSLVVGYGIEAIQMTRLRCATIEGKKHVAKPKETLPNDVISTAYFLEQSETKHVLLIDFLTFRSSFAASGSLTPTRGDESGDFNRINSIY